MSNCFISYSLHGLLQSLTVLKEDAKPLVFWWLGTRTFWLVGGYGGGEDGGGGVQTLCWCRSVEVSIMRQGSLSWGKDNYVNCNCRKSLSYFHQKCLSFCSFRRVTMSLCSMFLIWLLIYILMEWPSGKMLGESLHLKSIRNQSCQILFHVKCFQFASASHQDIRMFLTGERSVKIMSGASSNSAWTRSREILWIEEVSCSLWRAEDQE